MRALILSAFLLATVCVTLSLSAKLNLEVQGIGCEVCDALLKSVEKYLEGDHTEKEALDFMEKVGKVRAFLP